jgi:hypothetical protein
MLRLQSMVSMSMKEMRGGDAGVGSSKKKVDVMLTVDMLTHAFRKNMHKATLLTGDNDFKPLIDALVQDGMFVTLWYPTGETSAELMQAADARKPLNIAVLHQLLTSTSQAAIKIPHAYHQRPDINHGQQITSWTSEAKEHALFKDGQEFIVTKEHDALNKLCIRHHNYELLRVYANETFGIHLPEHPS